MKSTREATKALLETYYKAFNRQDMDGFMGLLADDVIHDINQGHREVGKAAFFRFLEQMNAYYREHIFDVEIMTNDDGSRAATEYTVLGIYMTSGPSLPPASGQTYRLRGGAFFEIENGKISRVTSYYNLQDWLFQIGDSCFPTVFEEWTDVPEVACPTAVR